MAKEIIPGSVPSHLVKENAPLWTVSGIIDWPALHWQDNHIISGSAFIDLENPLGSKGNPFTVVVGRGISSLSSEQKVALAAKTGTSETIFVNDCQKVSKSEEQLIYRLNLTVKTPTGKELGACAHGFTGAIQTLVELGVISFPSVVDISTTLDTTARVHISQDKLISLEFTLLEPQEASVDPKSLNTIFGVTFFAPQSELPILSVGSPKLMIELTPEQFAEIQKNLGKLDYESLLSLQNALKINGIHVFCRNAEDTLPEKVIQVNAFLGKENVVDPATGVSCAAQVGNDPNVKEGQTVKLNQYTAHGPSADLFVTKGPGDIVYVGGTATLFNFQKIGWD